MNEHFSDLGRYVSIFDRLMKMYYDHGLSAFEIGWGQQFYVEYIYEHPGASPQEMAECIRVDKATLSKTIKKLTEVGYIRVEVDEKDRRMKHLYLTEKALPGGRTDQKNTRHFFEDLQAGISREELTVTENTLRRMADNINKKVWHRMEEHHGK